MKRVIVTLFFVFLGSILFSDPTENADKMIVSIPVDFTLEKGVEGFFSRDFITSISDTPERIETLDFSYDSADEELTSETFYYNVKVFTEKPIAVSVESYPGFSVGLDSEGNQKQLGKTIEYTNIGRTAESEFRTSGGINPISLLKETDGSYKEPRSYWFEFNFVVYPEQLTASGMDSTFWTDISSIQTTLKLRVESI